MQDCEVHGRSQGCELMLFSVTCNTQDPTLLVQKHTMKCEPLNFGIVAYELCNVVTNNICT